MNNRALRDLDEAAFDSFQGDGYDPDGYDDNYDPDGYDDDFDPENYDEFGKRKGKGAKRGGGQRNKTAVGLKRSPMGKFGGAVNKAPIATFDVNIVSTFATAINIELFFAQYSISKIQNLTTNPAYEPLQAARLYSGTGTPAETFIGHSSRFLAAGDASGSTYNKVIYWADNGDLVYKDFTTATAGTCTISCTQVPYRALFDYSFRGAFTIQSMRMKFSAAGQIDNSMTTVEKSFLGLQKQNSIPISTYISPDQFQSLIVDMPVPIRIDADKGIQYTINAGNTVNLNMRIAEYSKSVL